MRKFVKYRKAAYAAMEREILDVWRKGGVFQASVDSRPAEKTYVFYDGPPFITGLPHHGTLLSSIVKDVVPRFKTMQGCRVERRWGWDCHGLPAENYVEKKLALEDKRAVLSYGLEKYITACRESMIQTGSLWEESIDRIGRWVEFQGAYKTMDASYMESVWWAFKRLYETGKVYEGEKVLVYCTRCATPVSKAEVAMDNSYRQVRDPSVYVKFSLPGEVRDAWLKRVGYDREPVAGLSLLAWTTTPWTLPANTAAAVNPELDYALVVFGEACYILAAESVGRVFTDETGQSLNLAPAGVFKGRELVGLVYEPLFEDRGSGAHRVLGADYVTTEDGSGIVHLAPAYGEEDYELAEAQGVPIVKNIDENGLYEAGPWRGRDAWEANEDIARSLLAEGKVLKLTEFDHSYPHCHRCGTRLMYRAHPSWFFDIGAVREQLLADNQSINWFPDHIKEGRFKAIIETAPDWNLSRDRFWATPLPVWRGVDPASGEEKTIVVGSYDELEELSGRRLEDYHRPWVDEIEFERDGVTYRRVDKVLDCWFESGSMPFAQYHYPFENKEFFDRNFPADFIVEYVGQVRAWFYYLHVIGVALFSKPAFTNVIVTGTILGSDGRKISKSLGNYTDPLELTDKYSADAYRLVLVDSPVLAGEDFSLTDKDVADKQRKLDTLRNTLEFFLLYAAADEWQADPGRHSSPPEPTNFFDRWLLVRLSELTAELTGGLENYDLPAATRPLQEFIDDLSNWYVRRNRKRFWKTDASADKEAAYHTLYFTLHHLAHLIAPLCPFLAEEIYRQLDGRLPSVHLADWPELSLDDDRLLSRMRRTRRCIAAGLALRAEAGVKVRQPLSRLTVSGDEQLSKLDGDFLDLMTDELNVKEVVFRRDATFSAELDTELSRELRHEGWVRELVRRVQVLRKTAGLEVENRIHLSLQTGDDELLAAFEAFADYVRGETLTVNYDLGAKAPSLEVSCELELNGHLIAISLQKA